MQKGLGRLASNPAEQKKTRGVAEILQIGVAYRAAERVCAKLGAAADSGRAVDMEEVFRLMTLQVIGEAVLSLPPEECDRVCAPQTLTPDNPYMCWPFWRHPAF